MTKKSRTRQPDAASERSALNHVKQRLDTSLLPKELVDLFQREGERIDVNVLLVNIVQKTDSTDKFLEEAEKLLGIAKRFEEERLSNFQRTADAVIDVKNRDPDEIEKRANNKIRRVLKIILASTSAAGAVGSGIGIWSGSSLVITGMLVALTGVCVSMLGPLASGESISSNDIVRIIHAVRQALPRISFADSPREDSKESDTESQENKGETS